jgi:hypothetical protein
VPLRVALLSSFWLHLGTATVVALEATVAKPIRAISRFLVLGVVASLASLPVAEAQQARQCTPAGSLVPLAGLAEASGLATSRKAPGRLWTHNDSGQPILFALDGSGAVQGQLRIPGAKVEDWEGVEVGPCGSGSCLYIGDIGDNEASRTQITIYRVPEPERPGGTAAVPDVFHATYPDGAHDAEALFFAADRLHIVTKGDTGPIALYRFPQQLQPKTTMKLERVGGAAPKGHKEARVTDGSVSPDGQWVVLRSRTALMFYRASDVLAGQWRAAGTVNLTSLNEPQGEGVAFGPGDTIFLAGEGGGKGQSGTFARLSCPAPTS